MLDNNVSKGKTGIEGSKLHKHASYSGKTSRMRNKSREKKVGKGLRKKKAQANRVDESEETLEEEEDEIEPEVLDVIVVERC